VSRYAWLGVLLAALSHILALVGADTSLTIGILAPTLVAGVVFQAAALIRGLQRGHSPISLLIAIPLQGKVLLGALLGYTLYYFVPLLTAVANGRTPDTNAWVVLGSCFALYICAFSALAFGVPTKARAEPIVVPEGDFVPTPSFRMAARSVAIIVASGVGFFALMPALLARNFGWAMLALFGWVVLLNGVSWLALRCPRCGKLATRSPSGWRSPFVGKNCRWCGQPY